MEYLDFELEVDLGTGREYPVSVVRSPAGEARATMVFPFDTLALRNHLQALEIALLRSSGTYRRAAPPEGAAVQEFGQALFAALLPSDIRGRYVVSREKAAAQGKGLRLKLRVRPPELAALPWEFLYDPDEADYICLSRSTPLVRYLEMPGGAQPLTIAPPLRVLAMVSSPSDMQSLDTARERQRVDEAMKDLVADGRVELHWLEGQTWRHLQEAMWGGPWHVFHFIGHGGFDTNSESGLLVLADDQGRAQRMSAEQVALLLNDHASLRLVLLNSCDGARAGDEDIFSSSAATLIRRGIPAVLAMQYEITDAAAIEFSRTFYRATAHGMPVDAAVAEARRAIRIGLGGSLEWGTPVLYMRSGDGRLFDLQGDPVAVATPPEEPPPPMPAEAELEPEPTPEGEPPLASVGEALRQLASDEPKPTVYVNLGLPERRGWRDKLASRWRYSMVIVNRGQEPVEVGLSAAGRDEDSCTITMPDAVTVLAGAQRYVPIAVRPRKRRLLGKLKGGGFTVTASGDGPDLPVTQQGYFSDSPSPLGMLGVGAVGLVAVLAGVGIVMANLGDGDDDDGGGDEGDEEAAAQETAAALDPGGPTGQVGFVSYRGGLERIYLVNADRSGEELLTPPGWTAVNPAWSPDGTILAFASDADGDYDIYVMRLGEEPVKVTENPTEDSAPTWSPDGSRIAYWTNRHDQRGDIYYVDTQSEREVPLAVQPGYDEVGSWSPDGQWFAYISEGADDPNSRELFIAGADGDNPVQITFFGERVRWPVFSPDSSLIAFATDVDGNWDVYITTLDGYDMAQLTYAEAFDGQPTWTPEGNAIVFSSDREGGSVACPPRYPAPCADRELYLVDLDGNEPVRFYGTPSFESEPAWRPPQE